MEQKEQIANRPVSSGYPKLWLTNFFSRIKKERWLMMTPSIFGENLFDEFFDDIFDFPVFDDKAMQKAQKKLYGRHAANMMKTDVREHDDHFEVDMDLPGCFRK
jgi:HSP20 family molecular chaperone IbpA